MFTPNAAVGTISATVTLDRKLDGDVRDEETVDIELLVLGVGLGVLEEVQDVLAALSGPSALSGLLYISNKKEQVKKHERKKWGVKSHIGLFVCLFT